MTMDFFGFSKENFIEAVDIAGTANFWIMRQMQIFNCLSNSPQNNRHRDISNNDVLYLIYKLKNATILPKHL